MKTLKLKGRTYKVRYITQQRDGSFAFVLEATGLEGKYGDEWPLEPCPGGYRPKGEKGPVIRPKL